MKNLTILLPIFLLFFATNSFAQASKKASQMFTLDKNITKLKIDVHSSNVEILHTKGSRVSIESTVKISSGSLQLLEYLDKSGRYELTKNINAAEGSITLSPTKIDKVIIVKGEEIQETITYKIYVPDNVLFVQTADSETMSALASNLMRN